MNARIVESFLTDNSAVFAVAFADDAGNTVTIDCESEAAANTLLSALEEGAITAVVQA